MRALRLSCVLLLAIPACAPSVAPTGRSYDAGGWTGDAGPGFVEREPPTSPMDPENCAEVRVGARRVTPTVTLVVDQSGSMEQSLGGGLSRWDAMRRALTADDGLVTALESQVAFGLALYSDAPRGSSSCPIVSEVPSMVMGRAAIDAIYRGAAPLGETPTGDALNQLIDNLPTTLDATGDPHIFILATDGDPDRCGAPNGHDSTSRQQSVDAVARAYTQGVRTYPLGVGLGTVSADHLAELAMAGSGGMSAQYWEAGDTTSLRDALLEIVRGELSCVLELEGMVQPGPACSGGTVTLNGEPLTCDDPNGWRLSDETHIEILGDSCDFLLDNDVTIDASFPCQAVVI